MKPESLGNGKCVKETAKAIRVELDDLGDKIWIPQSQVHENSEVWKDGQEGEVIVSDWFAKKEGLI